MAPLLHEALTGTTDLNVEQTVPRSLVHKRSLENVLLTGVSALADDRFICAGRLPTAHCFFNDAGRTPRTDILFYTELGRQASLVVSHTFLRVGLDEMFIFEGSDAALTDAAVTDLAGTSDHWRDGVVVQIGIRDIERRRNDSVSRVVAEHVMRIGGERVFHGTGAWTIQPAALFQRLRRGASRSATPDVATRSAGMRASLLQARDRNVVITPPQHDGTSGTLVSSLIVDQTHPYFFDHPCDHVPGMLLLEGCTQLALAASSGTPAAADALHVTAYDMTFDRFVETGPPTTLSAGMVSPDGGIGSETAAQSIHICIRQGDAVCGTATIVVATSGIA